MYFHIIGYSIQWFNEGIIIKFHGDWKSKIICFITNIFNPFTYVNIIKYLICQYLKTKSS